MPDGLDTPASAGLVAADALRAVGWLEAVGSVPAP
jgi:hypothetical protein